MAEPEEAPPEMDRELAMSGTIGGAARPKKVVDSAEGRGSVVPWRVKEWERKTGVRGEELRVTRSGAVARAAMDGVQQQQETGGGGDSHGRTIRGDSEPSLGGGASRGLGVTRTSTSYISRDPILGVGVESTEGVGKGERQAAARASLRKSRDEPTRNDNPSRGRSFATSSATATAVSRTGEAVDIGPMSAAQQRTIREATGAHSPRTLALRMTTSHVPLAHPEGKSNSGGRDGRVGGLPPPPPVLFADQLNPVYAAEARRRAGDGNGNASGGGGWKEHSRGAATRAADPSNFAKAATERVRPVAEF